MLKFVEIVSNLPADSTDSLDKEEPATSVEQTKEAFEKTLMKGSIRVQFDRRPLSLYCVTIALHKIFTRKAAEISQTLRIKITKNLSLHYFQRNKALRSLMVKFMKDN